MKRRTFIRTILLGSGGLFIGSQNLISAPLSLEAIRVIMIYNNIGHVDKLESKWGLSMWIENNEAAILFDTGGDPSILMSNLQNSEINLEKLSTIVISHKHWDHVNGLPEILQKTNKTLSVYVPKVDLETIRIKESKAKWIGVNDPVFINEHLWSTGQMRGMTPYGEIFEQSILITKDRFMYLITGCSHPGIVEIVERVKKYHPSKTLEFIIGGFHLLWHSAQDVKDISMKLKNLHVKNIAPSHCTGEQAMDIFKYEWEKHYIDFNIGHRMKI